MKKISRRGAERCFKKLCGLASLREDLFGAVSGWGVGLEEIISRRGAEARRRDFKNFAAWRLCARIFLERFRDGA